MARRPIGGWSRELKPRAIRVDPRDMPRRHLTSLLIALALLLLAAPATLAAGPAASAAPTARLAVDDECGADELIVEEEDGTISCLGDEDLGEDFGDDEIDALCEDDWSDEEDSGDDEGFDDEEAFVAQADDCDEEAAPAILRALAAKLNGSGKSAQVSVSFTLDAADTVTLALARTDVGTTTGKRCVARAAAKQPRKSAKKGKRCTRSTPFGGVVTVDGDEGANSIAPKRWKGRKLRPGSYAVTATPAGGASSTATFTIPAR